MKNNIIFVFLLLLSLIIISCKNSSAPTVIPTVNPSITMTLTKIVDNTATSIPSETPTPTRLPSLTPLPTYPPEQWDKIIEDLMNTNGGCKLPCWWGFNLGSINKYELQQKFAQFIFSFSGGWPNAASKKDGGIGFTYPDRDQVGIIYLVPDGEIIVGMRLEGHYAITTEYAIQDMFRKYGVPNEIWIYTWPYPIGEDVLQFIIALDYSSEGFLVYYFSEKGDFISETTAQLCYTRDLIPPKILLWNPNTTNPFLQKKSDYVYEIWDQMKPVEEATGISKEEFVSWFVNGTEFREYCIKTPSSIWQPP